MTTDNRKSSSLRRSLLLLPVLTGLACGHPLDGGEEQLGPGGKADWVSKTDDFSASKVKSFVFNIISWEGDRQATALIEYYASKVPTTGLIATYELKIPDTEAVLGCAINTQEQCQYYNEVQVAFAILNGELEAHYASKIPGYGQQTQPQPSDGSDSSPTSSPTSGPAFTPKLMYNYSASFSGMLTLSQGQKAMESAQGNISGGLSVEFERFGLNKMSARFWITPNLNASADSYDENLTGSVDLGATVDYAPLKNRQHLMIQVSYSSNVPLLGQEDQKVQHTVSLQASSNVDLGGGFSLGLTFHKTEILGTSLGDSLGASATISYSTSGGGQIGKD